MSPAPRHSVNFLDGDQISTTDRGFTYGDGLFETLRVASGRIPLWKWHASRLADGCARLGMPPPDTVAIHDEVHRLAQGLTHAVARVTVSRGEGVRGYALPLVQKPMVSVSVAPLQLEPAIYAEGIAATVCETRLALQPLLAGMKHLNRLEQVLARAEWHDPSIAEGVMLDTEGLVVCATAANIFAVVDGHLATPPVDRCGVAGVARAEILAMGHGSVVRMNLDRLLQADEVFLTSAVRGILPVRALAGHAWRVGPVARALQAHWLSLGLPLP